MRRLREPCWIFLAANQSLSLYCYTCPWVQVSSYECMPVLISVCHSSFLEIYSYTLLYWTLQLLSLRFFASTTHTLNLVCCHKEPFSWLVRIYSSHNAISQHNILQCPKLTVFRFYTYICHSSIVSILPCCGAKTRVPMFSLCRQYSLNFSNMGSIVSMSSCEIGIFFKFHVPFAQLCSEKHCTYLFHSVRKWQYLCSVAWFVQISPNSRADFHLMTKNQTVVLFVPFYTMQWHGWLVI